MMIRVPKMCEDDAKIVAAINAFTGATAHHSWNLSRERDRLGLRDGGSYYKLGKLKVHERDWKRLLAEHEIVVAEHSKVSYRSGRKKVFDWKLVKSRFGEKTVERSLMGRITYCDNAEAKAFYESEHEAAIVAINEQIDGGDLDGAIATKKQLQSQGRI